MKKILSPLFKNLADDEINMVLVSSCVRTSKYKKGDIIFSSGDITQEIGTVVSGSVNIENIDWWGNKSILNNVNAGQVFAETYAILGEPLMVDVVAAEDSEILFVNIQQLGTKTKMQGDVHDKILRNMLIVTTHKNLALSNRIFCTTAKSVRSRVLTYLTSQAKVNKSNMFQIPFNRQQLADYLNLDRTALSKELGKMRDEGILEFYKNSFKLKNVDEM